MRVTVGNVSKYLFVAWSFVGVVGFLGALATDNDLWRGFLINAIIAGITALLIHARQKRKNQAGSSRNDQ